TPDNFPLFYWLVISSAKEDTKQPYQNISRENKKQENMRIVSLGREFYIGIKQRQDIITNINGYEICYGQNHFIEKAMQNSYRGSKKNSHIDEKRKQPGIFMGEMLFGKYAHGVIKYDYI